MHWSGWCSPAFVEKNEGTTLTCLVCGLVVEWGWLFEIRVRDKIPKQHLCVSCYRDMIELEMKEW
jgi:hypothetical protein